MRRAARLPEVRKLVARAILTAPNFFCMPSDKRKAHATNERSSNAPRTVGEYKASHAPGLRLLLEQAFAPRQAEQNRREELPDRASMDDQPLMPRRSFAIVEERPVAASEPIDALPTTSSTIDIAV